MRRFFHFNDVIGEPFSGDFQFDDWAVEVTRRDKGVFLYPFFDPSNVVLGGLDGRRVCTPEIFNSVVSVAEFLAGGVSRQANGNSVWPNDGPRFSSSRD